MLAEEPDHCGGSIAATVGALWECRTKLAQQDDLVQAAVAAALREAVAAVKKDADNDDISQGAAQWVSDTILALITPDAQAALDRALAAERERCAKVAQQQAQAAQKEVTRLMKEHGSKTAEDIWTGRLIAAQEINAAIRKGGE